jgi:hypothetical protein
MVYPEAHPVVQYRGLVHKCEYCGRLLVAPNTSVPEESPETDLTAETSLIDDHEDDDAADDSALLAEVGNNEEDYQPDDDMLSHVMLQAEPNDAYFPDEPVEEPFDEEEPDLKTKSEDEDAQREEIEFGDIGNERELEEAKAEWGESEKHLREQGPENVRA